MTLLLSPAHLVGATALQASAYMLLFDASLAPWPLAAFLLSCAVAPFFPRLRYFLPIVNRGAPGERAVAVTFDDGPDPTVTPRVLELLDRRKVSATFFVTGRNAERHPELVREILSRGHAVGNHSLAHSPFLMLKGRKALRRDLEATQRILERFGVVPLAFRPPAGITNAHLWRVLVDLGMYCVGYSRRALDVGNRRVGDLAGRILRKAGPGDIVALHDVAPRDGDVPRLLREFDAVLGGLEGKGLAAVPLSRLIGLDVMRPADGPAAPSRAAMFYDGLADSYDREQFCSTVSISRRTELALFDARAPGLFSGADRVLEIGAGTGIFTIPIARRCRELVALDISARMLSVLERKAAAEGLDNVRILTGNAETVELPGTFSVVCAFSSLAYVDDLPAFFRRLAPHVEPGGTVYFITARRSLIRFFTQLGNAMRQGIWLKAYSRRQVTAMLAAAGFEPVSVTSHLFKSFLSGGILLEGVARRAAAGAPARAR